MSALGRLSHLEWGGCKPSRRESHESRQASRLANGLPSISTARLGGCATVCSIHVPQDRLALSNEPPMKCMSSANRSSVAHTAMTPLSDGGGEAAACSAAMPPQEHPRSTTCPSHLRRDCRMHPQLRSQSHIHTPALHQPCLLVFISNHRYDSGALGCSARSSSHKPEEITNMFRATHHACCAAHSTASFRSCKPWLLYSSSRWPSLSPLPRLSRRTHAKPCPAR